MTETTETAFRGRVEEIKIDYCCSLSTKREKSCSQETVESNHALVHLNCKQLFYDHSILKLFE